MRAFVDAHPIWTFYICAELIAASGCALVLATLRLLAARTYRWLVTHLAGSMLTGWAMRRAWVHYCLLWPVTLGHLAIGVLTWSLLNREPRWGYYVVGEPELLYQRADQPGARHAGSVHPETAP